MPYIESYLDISDLDYDEIFQALIHRFKSRRSQLDESERDLWEKLKQAIDCKAPMTIFDTMKEEHWAKVRDKYQLVTIQNRLPE